MSGKKWRVSTDKRVLGHFRGPKPEQAIMKAISQDKQYHPDDYDFDTKVYADKTFEHYENNVITLSAKKICSDIGYTFEEVKESVEDFVDKFAANIKEVPQYV